MDTNDHDTLRDEPYMRHALLHARQAQEEGEVPVGAVVVYRGAIISAAHNQPIGLTDPTAHAEMTALRAAAVALGAYRIPGVEMYVTLEPCIMCFGAMLHARVSRLVYAAGDPKVGFSSLWADLRSRSAFNHEIEICSGVLAEESAELLRSFFRTRR